MTAVSVINLILPIVAAILFVVALFFLRRGIRQRTHSSRAPYNVGRQEAQFGMRFDFARGVVALAVSLIVLGVFFLLPEPAETEPAPPVETSTPTPAFATPLPPSETPPPASPTTLPSPTPSPTTLPLTPSAIPTDAPTAEPLPTATLQIDTAVVTSGVGVWLRDNPSVEGEQVEWLLEGTVVFLLDGQADADEFEWQQVQAPSGNIGWVALPFIQLVEP